MGIDLGLKISAVAVTELSASGGGGGLPAKDGYRGADGTTSFGNAANFLTIRSGNGFKGFGGLGGFGGPGGMGSGTAGYNGSAGFCLVEW